MTDTKRVEELEVGDIVIPNGCKRVLTVSNIERRGADVYRVYFENMEVYSVYGSKNEFTYLGNSKKEEETMTTQKVGCSALYPYLDNLLESEPNIHVLDLPSYLNKELKNIHELFEDVLGLTLGEVKTLYFERKMSKQDSKIEGVTRTKKVRDLCIGDKIFLFLPYEDYEGEEIVAKLQEFSDTHIRIITEQDTEAILKKDKVVTLVD